MSTRVHISISVQDLQKSVQFYQHAFAAEPSKVKENYVNFRLNDPPIHLALVQSSNPTGISKSSDIEHFGIELPDQEQFNAKKAAAEATGLSLFIEDDVVCCYAKADKFWLTDPDGHKWEFWNRKEDADSMFENKTSDENPVCCG